MAPVIVQERSQIMPSGRQEPAIGFVVQMGPQSHPVERATAHMMLQPVRAEAVWIQECRRTALAAAHARTTDQKTQSFRLEVALGYAAAATCKSVTPVT